MANKDKPRQLINRAKLSALVHSLLNIALPIAALLLVRANLSEVAIGLVLLSKWRVFAVMPRHWAANLRSNATDAIVSLSSVVFMILSASEVAQIGWAVWYGLWLLVLKPRSDKFSVALQALAGLALGITATLQYDNLYIVFQLLIVWYIATSAARHFLSSYEEPMARGISYIWGLLVTQLAWILYHWTLAYFTIPQLTLVVSLAAYTFGSLYDHHKKDDTNKVEIRQHIMIALVILLVVISFANWQGQV